MAERTIKMKTSAIAVIALVFVCLVTTLAAHADSGKTVDHSAHVGDKIHESTVSGYQLAYHLLDLPNNDKHHLMVYISNPEGKSITEAKVGYLILGPNKEKQKVMAMKTSFAGDIDFTRQGSYTVKAKIVVGEDKLLDSFTHDIK